jgi:hypothetical protein
MDEMRQWIVVFLSCRASTGTSCILGVLVATRQRRRQPARFISLYKQQTEHTATLLLTSALGLDSVLDSAASRHKRAYSLIYKAMVMSSC